MRSFRKYPIQSGIAVRAASHVGWSSCLVDYDNDSDLDIIKINGELKHLYGQEDQIFENDGNETFHRSISQSGANISKKNWLEGVPVLAIMTTTAIWIFTL